MLSMPLLYGYLHWSVQHEKQGPTWTMTTLHGIALVIVCVITFSTEAFNRILEHSVQCSTNRNISCVIYKHLKGCSPPDLAVTYPSLFSMKYDSRGQYWPGKPLYFTGKEHFTSHKVRTVILTWTPPGDSSVSDLRGFFITVTATDGPSSGESYCYVISLNNTSSVTIRDVYTVIITPVHTSTTFHFRLYSLPLPDPLQESIGGQYSKTFSLKTSEDSSNAYPANWKTSVTCEIERQGVLNVRFPHPPKEFHFTVFLVTLRYLTSQRNYDLTTVYWNLNQSVLDHEFFLNTLNWNATIETKETGHYELGITPMDKQNLQGCLCYGENKLCRGSCKTSFCLVPSENSIGEVPVNLNQTQRKPETLRQEEIVDVRVYISVPGALVFSIGLAFFLFLLNRKFHFTEHFRKESQRRSNDVSDDFEKCNNKTCHHEEPFLITPDDFIKPDLKDSDVTSLSLSQQMLEINEIYLHKLQLEAHYSDGNTECTSLGGKSV